MTPAFFRGAYGLGFAIQPMLLLFWVIAGLTVVVFVVAWQLIRPLPERIKRALALVAVAAVSVAAWRLPLVDCDEVEHLHGSWLMSQGLLPFTDFWEHHSPLIWIVLSPLLRSVQSGATALDLGRIISVLLALVCAGLCVALAAKVFPRSRVAVPVILLWTGALIPGEMYNLRPDLFSNVLVLGALCLYLYWGGLPGALISGGLIGLGIAFCPKYLVILPLLPIVVLYERRRLAPLCAWLAPYLLGLALGVAPLLVWLHTRGLLAPFRHWVFGFNAGDRGVLAGGLIPLLPLLLAGLWVVARLRARTRLSASELTVIGGLCLASLVTLLQPGSTKSVYNLQLFLLLAAVGGVGGLRVLGANAWMGRRPAVMAGLAGLWAVGVAVPLVFGGIAGLYSLGQTEIAALEEASQGGTFLGRGADIAIVRRDAIDLNLAWQWKWMYMPELQARLPRLADDLIASRPAIIIAAVQSDLGPESFVIPSEDYLVALGAISCEDALRLKTFLHTNYRRVTIVWRTYWLRNDIPLPANATLLVGVPTR